MGRSVNLGASLLATGWMVWFALLLPRVELLPNDALAGAAAMYVLLALACSAAITLGLYVTIAWRVDAPAFTLDRMKFGAWLAPGLVSLAAPSPGSVAAGIVLVASATRLLCLEWRLRADEGQEPAAPSRVRSYTASFTLQGGAAALLMGHPLLAAALLGTGVALLAFFATTGGAWPVKNSAGVPRSVAGVLLTVILGAALLTGGRAHGHGGGDNPAGNGSAAGTPVAAPAYPPPSAGGEIKDAGFPGVVIWPEIQPHTMLVPPLPAYGPGLLGMVKQPRLSIPFAGQYWLFKAPFRFPPPQSLVRRGSPLDLGFVTTDHRPMRMEAHHRFDQPIDVRCCGRIDLEIWNEDRYPGTVTLELILIDSTATGRVRESLGSAGVLSAPSRSAPWRGGETLPARETLEFRMPANGPLREFNELEAVFHRDRIRVEHSARISIERIVLIPPGA